VGIIELFDYLSGMHEMARLLRNGPAVELQPSHIEEKYQFKAAIEVYVLIRI
jgi:hypothetical protein